MVNEDKEHNLPAESEHLTHPKYRADIDGLRAIAVLAVVGFHAFPYTVIGGFIGVDVFFVISGFLISTIIFNNLKRNSFSFVEFYSRRIRRIFPALLLILISSYAFGWIALLADEYKQLGKHIAAGAGFVSNIALWSESGYFDNVAETKPLLHLWSLGVEEQFYIVWPLLIWLAWRKRFNLLIIISTLGAASFALNIGEMRSDAVAMFYSPQTRFWELMMGSALAYIGLYKKNFLSHHNYKLNDVQSLVGAALITIGILVITKEDVFPGWWAVLPTVGAALIISAGTAAWLNRVILSSRVLVWFGLLSYPLYLWHWPVLSFARIVEGGTPEREIRVVAVIISIAFAWLTYQLIERPIRFGSHSKAKTITLGILMIGVSIIGYGCYKYQGYIFRDANKNSAFFQDLTQPDNTRNSDGSCGKYLGIELPDGGVCLTRNSAPDVLILGDSHAMSVNSAAYSGRFDLNSLLISARTCLPFINYRTGMDDKVCPKVAAAGLRAARTIPTIKTILFVSRGPFYFTGRGFGLEGNNGKFIYKLEGDDAVNQGNAFIDGYATIARELISAGKTVIFIIDVPEVGLNPRDCIPRPLMISKRPASACSIEKHVVMKRQADYRNYISEIQNRNQALIVFDSLNIFCQATDCYAADKDSVYYFDDDHLSISGSLKLLRALRDVALL